jgi:DNA topoisomerase VI subunit B
MPRNYLHENWYLALVDDASAEVAANVLWMEPGEKQRLNRREDEQVPPMPSECSPHHTIERIFSIVL